MDNGHIRQRNNGGFTLLELMIVIVILGILGAIVAPKFMDEPHKARVVQAKMQIENLSTAVKKFYLDNGFYPSTEQGLEALVTRPAIGKTPKNYPANGYITKIPFYSGIRKIFSGSGESMYRKSGCTDYYTGFTSRK